MNVRDVTRFGCAGFSQQRQNCLGSPIDFPRQRDVVESKTMFAKNFGVTGITGFFLIDCQLGWWFAHMFCFKPYIYNSSMIVDNIFHLIVSY